MPKLPAVLRDVEVEHAVKVVLEDLGAPPGLAQLLGHHEHADKLTSELVVSDLNDGQPVDEVYTAKIVLLDTTDPPNGPNNEEYDPPGRLGGATKQELRIHIRQAQRNLARIEKDREGNLTRGEGGGVSALTKALGQLTGKAGEEPSMETSAAENMIARARANGAKLPSQAALLPGPWLLTQCAKAAGSNRKAGDPAMRPRWPGPAALKPSQFDTLATEQDGHVKPHAQGARHASLVRLKVVGLQAVTSGQAAPRGLTGSAGAGGFLFTDEGAAEFTERTAALELLYPSDVDYKAHLDRVEEVMHRHSEKNDFDLTVKRGIEFSIDLHDHRPMPAVLAAAAGAAGSAGAGAAARSPGQKTGPAGGDGTPLTPTARDAIKKKFRLDNRLEKGTVVHVSAAGMPSLGASPMRPLAGGPPFAPPGGPPPGFPPPSQYNPYQQPPYGSSWMAGQGPRPPAGGPRPPPGPPPGAPPSQGQGNPASTVVCADWRAGKCNRQACKFRHSL